VFVNARNFFYEEEWDLLDNQKSKEFSIAMKAEALDKEKKFAKGHNWGPTELASCYKINEKIVRILQVQSEMEYDRAVRENGMRDDGGEECGLELHNYEIDQVPV